MDKTELKKQIALTKANIETFEKAAIGGTEVQDIHWQRWLRFEKDLLASQQAILKFLEDKWNAI